jgi:O-antigen/teichoic acid export membrane protein
MALFPQTRCPKCNGPVTFFEVMSIVTPFQSIDCSTCGEMVFLKHKSELFLISIGLGVLTFVVSLYVLINSILPTVVTYSAGFLFLMAAEVFITAHIVRHHALVVRRNKIN